MTVNTPGRRFVPAILWLLVAMVPASGSAQADYTTTVTRFLQAFNAQDASAMGAMVTDDIQWFSIAGSELSPEVESKAALVEVMRDYFASCPSCRSRLEGIMASRERVSTVEVASWESRSGPRSQRSVAVYEFAGPLIRAVYYFPAETDSRPGQASP